MGMVKLPEPTVLATEFPVNVALDTEDAKATKIEINNCSVWIVEKNNKIQMLMVKGNIQYILLGNIKKEVGIEILESLK